jgi:porphobilinogen synthase
MDILQGGYFHATLRKLHSPTLLKHNLMLPLFVTLGETKEIDSMPGISRWSVKDLPNYLIPLVKQGLKSILIFGVIDKEEKDESASRADALDGPSIVAIKLIKEQFPNLLIASDVCLCPFTANGHCGFVTSSGLDTTRTNTRLAEIALAYAQAGCHLISPSDMMDGRIKSIKEILVKHGLQNSVGVMSYSAKFASCFYGPFREAADTKPSFGDRKTYQLPPGSSNLAVRAFKRDMEQGADIIMVKPGLAYLDIVKAASDELNIPIAVYQVSGEYAMLYHGAKAGAFDLKDAVLESMTAFQRAGATLIISYFTPMLLELTEA